MFDISTVYKRTWFKFLMMKIRRKKRKRKKKRWNFFEKSWRERQAVSEKSGPFCPNPKSIITTRVFTTTQILLSRLSRNGLTSLYYLYHKGYKIVYLKVVVLQSVEYSIAMYSLRAKWATFFPHRLAATGENVDLFDD